MTLDWDEKIRMDPSSPSAMASLVARRDDYDILTGNDADADRHGIVTPDAGLMNPNHYLAVAIDYLYSHRPDWPADAAVGKTLVSSMIIDRVVASLGRTLLEVPVGFKWFVPGPARRLGRVRRRGVGGRLVPAQGRHGLDDRQGRHPAVPARRRDPRRHRQDPVAALRRARGRVRVIRLSARRCPGDAGAEGGARQAAPDAVTATELAGEPITAKLSHAPGNGAAIGGLKVTTEHAWFAARPSGTEDVYKLYAESLRGPEHLAEVQEEARAVVSAALGDA